MAFTESFRTTRTLVESDGVQLNVLHAGNADGPPVVFVHGYPDTLEVWMPTIARLVDDFHCIAYDVRGAGRSTAPDATEGYRMSHLSNDLVSVIGSTDADRVHLVGHDWGSAQCWDAVLRAGTDRRLRGRLASYTSISGPSAGHFQAWVRRSRRGDWRQRRDLVRQLSRSWYMAWFQVPRLPELGVRATLAGPAWLRNHYGLRHTAPTIGKDAVNGLGIYRANLRDRSQERQPLTTDLPIQLVVPLRDPFLLPAVYDDLPLWCSNLVRHDIDAGHWVQRTHPDQLADWIGDFVRTHV
jgi:pimeloyl-ACP methyl ester carboxylesterase